MKPPRLRVYRPPLDEAQRRAVDRLIAAVRRLSPQQRARLDRHLDGGAGGPRPAA